MESVGAVSILATAGGTPHFEKLPLGYILWRRQPTAHKCTKVTELGCVALSKRCQGCNERLRHSASGQAEGMRCNWAWRKCEWNMCRGGRCCRIGRSRSRKYQCVSSRATPIFRPPASGPGQLYELV